MLQSINNIPEIDGERFRRILDSHLYYYYIDKKYRKKEAKGWNKNHFITGSILAAFLFQVGIMMENGNLSDTEETSLRNIIKLFIEYGAILYHNDRDNKFNDILIWNENIESYPKIFLFIIIEMKK